MSNLYLFLAIAVLAFLSKAAEGRCSATVKIGSRGDCVKEVQQAVGISADGIFGSNTKNAVIQFQRNRGLTADGIVGQNTWAAIYSDGYSSDQTTGGRCTATLKIGSRGNCVRIVQKAVGTSEDGTFGSNTQNAVIAFQRSRGLSADGVVGRNTWAAIYGDGSSDNNDNGESSTNSAAVDLIAKFEGYRANFYLDSVGVKTIGYGHACHSDPQNCRQINPPLSEQQAKDLLQQDLKTSENCVRRNVKVPINSNQFAALTSFVYNLGCGKLQSSESTIRQKLNSGDIVGAANEFGRFNHAGGKVLAGLTRRRSAERALFCSGDVC